MYNCGFDGFYNVSDIIVGDIGTGGKTDADFEE